MTHIRIILKHLCFSGMLDIIQSKITWFWGYILLPLLCSMLISPDFDVKLIIFSQFWPEAFSQNCWKKNLYGNLCFRFSSALWKAIILWRWYIRHSVETFPTFAVGGLDRLECICTCLLGYNALWLPTLPGKFILGGLDWLECGCL